MLFSNRLDKKKQRKTLTTKLFKEKATNMFKNLWFI